MKKNLFFIAALLVAMTGCNKEPQQGGPADGQNDDAVFMSFKVSTLDTKSSTDDDEYYNSNANPDFEVGTDAENKIQSIDLLLVKLDADGAETDVVVRADNVEASPAQTDVYVATFNTKEGYPVLEETNYNVYIYANADAKETLNKVADKTTVASANLKAEGGIAEAGKFFMTSSKVEAVTVADLAAHTTPAHPLDLGVYEVQRAAARFDLATAAANTVFTMVEDNTETGDVNEQVTLTFTKVALINAGKEFYDFKRVTPNVADGVPSNESTAWTILGLETSNNWVVDAEWGTTPTFFNPLAPVQESTYPWTAISGLTTEDNWTAGEQVENHPVPAAEYYPWTYAVENTLQGVEAQKKKVTTGVVFKAKIEGALVDAADQAPIYVFGNVLYGTWDKMKAKAFAEGSDLYALQAAINAVEAVPAESRTAATYADAGFTGYSYDVADGGYFATYYYWNRHNDNGNNDVMGIMEFAVVRNNVYKLAVTEVAKYGHPYNPDPNDPNPDPDPENPADPDESVNYYFSVSVKVLPWIVRINNIEF